MRTRLCGTCQRSLCFHGMHVELKASQASLRRHSGVSPGPASRVGRGTACRRREIAPAVEGARAARAAELSPRAGAAAR